MSTISENTSEGGSQGKRTNNSRGTEAGPQKSDEDLPKNKERNVTFNNKTHTSEGRNERLKDFALKDKMAAIDNKRPIVNFEKFKKKWDEEKRDYKTDLKDSDDDLVSQFKSALDINRVADHDMVYLFEKFRDIRELLIRMRSLDTIKLVRRFMGLGRCDLVLEILKFITHDAYSLQFVEEEDYKISGISEQEKEVIIRNIELDPENDDECERWIAYILFFSDPANNWVRMRRKFEKAFFKLIDTCVIQAMINRDLTALTQLTSYKIPEGLESTPENKMSPIQRADKTYSSSKRNSCLPESIGQRGKLMLLMIRLGSVPMVQKCLDQGVGVNSKCATGQTKRLVWSLDEDEVAKEDEEGEEPRRKRKKKPLARPDDKYATLKTLQEYETPLSVAVSTVNHKIIKKLMEAGANPLRCDDIAVRETAALIGEEDGDEDEDHSKTLATSISEHEFVFRAICVDSQEKLRLQMSKRGYFYPNHCAVVLMYQTVLESLPAIDYLSEIAVVPVKTKKKNMTVKNRMLALKKENKFIKILNEFIISKTPGLTVKAKEKKGNKLFKRPFGKAKKVKEEISDVRSVFSGNTMMMSAKDSGMAEMDINQDLCYVVLKTIDMLVQDILLEDAANHARALLGIVSLTERFSLLLDDLRFERIMNAVTQMAKNPKAGDREAIVALFGNKQFRHFLGFQIDPTWEYRKVTLFFKKSQTLQKLVRFEGKLATGFESGQDKESVLKEIFFGAIRMNLPVLMKDLNKNGIRLHESELEEASMAAFEESAVESLQFLVQLYGKKLLFHAFTLALALDSFDGMKLVMNINEMKENADASVGEIVDLTTDDYDLVESYIHFVMKSTAAYEPSEGLKRRGIEKQVAPDLEIVVEFFMYARSDISIARLRDVLDVFLQKQNVELKQVESFVQNMSEIAKRKGEIFVTREVFERFLDTKAKDHDESEDNQVRWLKIMFLLYRFAASDQDLKAEYDEKVVEMLETQPEHFKEFIVEDDDVATESSGFSEDEEFHAPTSFTSSDLL